MAINPAEITTIRVGELPVGTISLSSKVAIENGTDLYQTDMQGLVDFMNINVGARQFQIIDLWVTQVYIDDNFDGTGMGTGICEGTAICNGQNGTPNLDGLVSIGYGNNYNIIKAIGGSKNAVVVEHSHTMSYGSGGVDTATQVSRDADGNTYIGLTSTNSTGVSGLNKNMQPYMVLLKIMKL